jgi:signal peptidase II
MQKADSPQGKRWWHAVFSLIVILVVVGDQFSKAWIRSNLAVGQSLPEGGFFRLTHIHNTGAAFGLFQGHSFPLTIASFAGIVILLVYVFFVCRRFPLVNNMLSRAALGAVLGGTVGNLIDRLNFGYVTDFIGVGIWPPFNVADASITVGAVVFVGCLIYLLFSQKQEAKRGKVASQKD